MDNLSTKKSCGIDELSTHFRQYHKTLAKKLRLLKSNNAKEYRQIINGTNQKETTQKLSLYVLKDHFKKLNCANNNNPENRNIIYNSEKVHEFLDKPFTEEEIQRLIRKLKNGKSSGEDNILNEFLKNSSHRCLELYVKLFNLVLETGIVPDDLCTGCIIPLYKGEGSKDDVITIGA